MSFEKHAVGEIHTEEYKKIEAQLLKIFVGKDHDNIEKIYSEIRLLAGIAGLDPEPVIEEIKNNLDLKSPEELAGLTLEVSKKIIDFKIEHPEIYYKMKRTSIIERNGGIRLSELMYYTVNPEKGIAEIHVAPKGDLELSGILKSLHEGMPELARQVKNDKRIKEIQATSWIVFNNPRLLEKMGFVVDGPLDDEAGIGNFDDDRPVAKAHISRENLLVKYLKV